MFVTIFFGLCFSGWYTTEPQYVIPCGYPALSPLLSGIFFLDRRFIAASNVARMEAMLLFVVCLGFCLLQGGGMYKGLSLLCVSPLIHLNGLLLLAGTLGYCLMGGRFRNTRRSFSRSDGLFLAIAICIWICCIFYVACNWRWFLHDMG